MGAGRKHSTAKMKKRKKQAKKKAVIKAKIKASKTKSVKK